MITPFPFDESLLLALNFDGGPLLDTIMYLISGKLIWVPLYMFLVWMVYRRGGWPAALLFLVAAALMVLCADQTASLFKHHLPKFRPTHYPPLEGLIHTVEGYRGGLYGTVSSHAANSFGLALLTSLVVRRGWLTWSLFLWAAVVSYSRIYLAVHYPVDILLGTAEGLLWGWIWFSILAYTLRRMKLSTPNGAAGSDI